jgi:hypothetical protein
LGFPCQGHGYAAEAARALVGWLADREVHEVVAHIHPDHAASARVARRAGLQPTGGRRPGRRRGGLAHRHRRLTPHQDGQEGGGRPDQEREAGRPEHHQRIIDGFARSLRGAGQAEGGSSASASTVWKRAPTER